MKKKIFLILLENRLTKGHCLVIILEYLPRQRFVLRPSGAQKNIKTHADM